MKGISKKAQAKESRIFLQRSLKDEVNLNEYASCAGAPPKDLQHGGSAL